MMIRGNQLSGKIGLVMMCLTGLLAASGCGPRSGALLYFMGVGSGQKVPAEFELPEGPLIILVDDDLDLVQPPTAKEVLVDELATLLKTNEAATTVTTNDELKHLRRAHADFDELKIREVGKLAKADTMIWICVLDYAVHDDLELVVTPGRFSVRLKVFNIKETDKSKIRLWPPDRQGRMVKVEVSPHDIRQRKTKEEVHVLVGERMAEEIGKLFYETKMEE
jgi:hypothetical protein